MKSRKILKLIITISIFNPSLLFSEPIELKTKDGTISLNVSIAPVFHSNLESQSQMEQFSQQTSTETRISTKTIRSMFDEMDQMRLKSQSYIIGMNKFKLFLYAFALAYGATWLIIKKSTILIEDPDSWSNWRAGVSLENFLSLPQKELGYELAITVQKKYLNFNKPHDTITPVSKFLHDIEKETNRLKRFVKLATYMDKLYLTKIFPFTKAKIEVAREKIGRLAYLKNVFLTWTTERNMEQLVGTTRVAG